MKCLDLLNVIRQAKQPMINVLLIYSKHPGIFVNASTISDHINAFAEFADPNKFHVHKLNLITSSLSNLKLSNFDVIIIHYSLVIKNSNYLPPGFRLKLQEFNCLKILFIQDEYRFINDTMHTINALGIDILYTCVPTQEIHKVYSEQFVPGVLTTNTLTGYVPHNLTKLPNIDYHSRQYDVSYRAREIPAWLGQLGREKIMIADLFPKKVKSHRLKLNINCSEHGRVYGQKWLDLLLNSKAALGTESGASVFDFNGSIQTNVENHVFQHPNTSFDELKSLYFKDEEGKIYLNQISPRCFEYASCRTMMILFEGKYSNILKPWMHFIPLKKDFSNINDVIDVLQNEKSWKKITDNAYNDLIHSNQYSYEKFITCFYKQISEHPKLISHTSSPPTNKSIAENNSFTFLTSKNSMKLLLSSLLFKILPKHIFEVILQIYKKYRSHFLRAPKLMSFENANAFIAGKISNQRVFFQSADDSNSYVFCLNKHKLCSSRKNNFEKNVSLHDIERLSPPPNGHKEEYCNICKNYIM
jgi:hypothetical protein